MPLSDARLAEIAARQATFGVVLGSLDFPQAFAKALQLARQDVPDLLAEVRRLREGLAELEWGDRDPVEPLDPVREGGCYVCCRLRFEGHAPGCKLAALIGGTDG